MPLVLAWNAPVAPFDPVIISSITEGTPTVTTEAISWYCAPAAQGQIEYGLTASYDSVTTLESGYLTFHSQTITGLSAGTLYHYRIKAISVSGAVVYSADDTFTTAVTGVLRPATVTLTLMTQPSMTRPVYGAAPAAFGLLETEVVCVSPVVSIRHAYSRHQAWSRDGDLLLLAGPGASAYYLLDGNTYAVLDATASPPGHPQWANTVNARLYGSSNNVNTLRQVDYVSASSWPNTTVHTFTGYDHISFGEGEGAQSDDDRYFALFGRKSGGASWWLISYDRVADTILGEMQVGGTGADANAADINNCTMSRSGDWVVLQFDLTGSSFAGEQGTWLFNRDLRVGGTYGPIRQLTTLNNHADMGKDVAGHDVYIHSEGNNVKLYDLTTATTGSILTRNLLPASTAFPAGHISARCLGYNGWVLLSSYNGTLTSLGHNLIALVAMDGSAVSGAGMKLYAWDHDSGTGGVGTAAYEGQPQATVNRDATKVLWSVDWDTSSPANVRAFVAGVSL